MRLLSGVVCLASTVIQFFASLIALVCDRCLRYLDRKAQAGLPPARISLTPLADDRWIVSKDVWALAQRLEAAGFAPAGTYDVSGFEGARYGVFLHQTARVAAVITGLGKKTWLDLRTFTLEGGSFTVSSVEDPRLPQPPWGWITHVATVDVPAMLEQVVRARGEAPARLLSPKTIPDLLVREYDRHAEWLSERGGYTREELCQGFLHGKSPDHPDVFGVRELHARHALMQWWARQPDLPGMEPEEFRECVTIVHDDLLPETVEHFFAEATGDWEAELKDLPSPGSPRETFAALNATRGEPLVCIAVKDTPLEADFYVHRSAVASGPAADDGSDEVQSLQA